MSEDINNEEYQGDSGLVDAFAAVAMLLIAVGSFAYWLHTL